MSSAAPPPLDAMVARPRRRAACAGVCRSRGGPILERMRVISLHGQARAVNRALRGDSAPARGRACTTLNAPERRPDRPL
eukprot:3515569-Prymnesium_polylepis.1